MNYSEQDRRSKLKQRYIRGVKVSQKTTSKSACLAGVSGTGISKLEIFGKSTFKKRTPTQLINYYLNNIAEMYSAGVTGAKSIPLPDYLLGKEITVSVSNPNGITGFQLYLADSGEFIFSNSELILDSNGAVYSVTGSAFTDLTVTCDDLDKLADVMEQLFKNITINLTVSEELSCDYLYEATDLGDKMELNMYGTNILPPLNTLEKTVHNGRVISTGTRNITVRFTALDGYVAFKLPRGYEFYDKTISMSFVFQKYSPTQGAAVCLYEFDGNNFTRGIQKVCQGTKNGNAEVSGLIQSSGGVCKDIYLIINTSNVSNGLNQSMVISNINLCIAAKKHDSAYKCYGSVKIPDLRLGSGDTLVIDRENKTAYYEETKKPWDLSKPLADQESYESPKRTNVWDKEYVKSILAIYGEYGSNMTVTSNALFRLDYYTVSAQEKCTLTLKLVDESTGEVIESKQYQIRVGSSFRISPPYKSGYKSKSTEIMGKATSNTEITLFYEKE